MSRSDCSRTVMLKLLLKPLMIVFVLHGTIGGIFAAETRYVSDRLIVAIREGKGNNFPISSRLKSDDPVTVIQEDDLFLKVRTRDGIEGWIAKQYVTPDLPKSGIIGRLEEKVENLEKKLSQQRKSRLDLQKNLKAAKNNSALELKKYQEIKQQSGKGNALLNKKLEELTAQYNKLLDQSKNFTTIVDEHKVLKDENERLTQDLNKMKQKNARPRPPAMFWWFVAGGGVFLAGLAAGIAATRKKKFYIDI